MRRIASTLIILAASVLISGSTLMANEAVEGNYEGKDVCLLLAMNCSDSVDSIQMRIERLNREIAKGTDVYTNEELKVLRRELEDTVKNLESIVSGS